VTTPKNRFFMLLPCFFLLVLSACTGSVINYSSYKAINLNSKIVVIPFANYTETPLAGERAMSITASLLKSRGIDNVLTYQNNTPNHGVLLGMDKATSRKTLLAWARSTGARYAMTGSINEWTYKVGLDGEPVVGISLQLIELSSKHTVWTAVGSVSGGSRIAVSTVAQKLINSMLDGLFKLGHLRP
jgi:polysaccharide biosynthesis protein PelC